MSFNFITRLPARIVCHLDELIDLKGLFLLKMFPFCFHTNLIGNSRGIIRAVCGVSVCRRNGIQLEKRKGPGKGLLGISKPVLIN